MALLVDLIERYGTAAVITVSPYVDDSGERLRWVLRIDGAEVSEADVRVVERDGRGVMFLADRDEEIELRSWRTGTRGGPQSEPGAVVDTLGAIQRRRVAN